MANIIFPDTRNGRPLPTIQNIRLVMEHKGITHYRDDHRTWVMSFPTVKEMYDTHSISRALLKDALIEFNFISPTVSIGTIKAMRSLVEPQGVQA